MLTITVNTGDLSEKLDSLPGAVKAALLSEANGIAALLLGIVKEKAGGEVLKVRTGSYLESIKSHVKDNPKSVTGSVFTKDPRAAILEWGGRIPAHVIEPVNARALHFLPTGGEVFAAVVHSPGAQISPHPVFHSTYQEEKDNVAARLVAAGSVAATEAI